MGEPSRSLLRKGPAAPGKAVLAVNVLAHATGEGERRLLRCASCRRAVTSRDAAIEVDGRHEHVRRNPAGFVYRIGCFRDAPGCAAEGLASEEWSWFPGYAWQIGLCAGCGWHLGWVFVLSAARFYGLIVDRLVGGDGDRAPGSPS